jgi:hypothetical protein
MAQPPAAMLKTIGIVAVADFEYRWAEGRNKRDRG